MTVIVWATPARNALREIFGYITAANPLAARRVQTEIRESARRLEQLPMSGRIGRVDGSRESVIPRTPYVLAYRVADDTVTILHIFHGAQQWPDKL